MKNRPVPYGAGFRLRASDGHGRIKNMNDKETKVALFDLDGTLVKAHLWVGLAKYNLKNKEDIISTLGYLITHTVLMIPWKMHLIPSQYFYKSWVQDMPQLIKGMDVERAKEIFNWLADYYLLPTLRNDTLGILKKHQKEGFITVLISGSFQGLLDIIADRLGFNFAIGTESEIRQNKFSGKIIPPACSGQGKLEKTRRFFSGKGLKINFKESFAYADSFVDLPILELVGNPVAVSPDEKLKEFAQIKGWQII